MKDNNSSGVKIGFPSLLTLLFIGLKLGKVIDWRWWWILSPLWISAGIAFIFMFVVLLILTIKYRKKPDVIESFEIEAWQFTKENFEKGVPDWIKSANCYTKLWRKYSENFVGGYGFATTKEIIGGEIDTSLGAYEVHETDYIVKVDDNELSVCDAYEFKNEYEKLNKDIIEDYLSYGV